MNTIQNRDDEQKGIGFAILLLTAGLIWFLFAIKLIPASGVNIALRLWPLALVAIGADLLLRKQSRQIAMYIVLAIAAFVILAALIAPRLGIGVMETITDTYTEQIGDAESASINLRPGVGELNIQVLASEDVLFNAEATHLGEVDFAVHGGSQRQIDFGQNQVSTTGWMSTAKDLIWNIGLTPHIPLRLMVNTGVGTANLDLTGLNLATFNLTGGVGEVNVVFPNQENPYQVDIDGGVGDFEVWIPENADVYVTVSGGVGNLVLDVPDNAAVRVRVSSGLGGVSVPSWLTSTDLGTDEQVWQSADFESATRRISIVVESGLGDLVIR
jgi:predicted membrane protein